MPTIQHTLVLCPKPEARLAVLRQFLKGVKAATVVFFDEKRLTLLPKIASALKQDDLRVDVLNEFDDLESRSSAFEARMKDEVRPPPRPLGHSTASSAGTTGGRPPSQRSSSRASAARSRVCLGGLPPSTKT